MKMSEPRVSTGIGGLDEVLRGGWLPARGYVVCGGPGVGKTTTGMHFLAAGMKAGEPCLFVSFDETQEQTAMDAESLGLNLKEVAFLDLTPHAETFSQMQTYDLFSPSEVEKDPIARMISQRIETIAPKRIFIDGFSQFGHLANDGFHLRRLVQACFRFVSARGATLLVSCDGVDLQRDREIQSAADGVLMLDSSDSVRQLRVTKFRGSNYQAGWHLMRLTDEGMIVSPTAA
jgi:circadian clock protein KaiC